MNSYILLATWILFLPASIAAFSSTRFPTKKTKAHLILMSNANDEEGSSKLHVIIAGGGVVGTCTAYYLAKNHGISSTIVDPSGEIAPAASGKAGGFLALGWNPGPLAALERRSFALHQEIADSIGAGKIDYRRLTCASIGVDSNNRKPSGRKFKDIEWAEDDSDGRSGVVSFQLLGNEETIAQVHPKKLCSALWEESCKIIGASSNSQKNELVKGKVTSMKNQSDSGKSAVIAILDDGKHLEADSILISCGPWSMNIMTGVKYHSVIIPTEKVLNQCVFFSGAGDPEIYVRPDSTAYCTGFPDPPVKVTEHPGEERVRQESVDRIVAASREASGKNPKSDGNLASEPISASACYLPSSKLFRALSYSWVCLLPASSKLTQCATPKAPDGLPIMGILPKEVANGCDNCYVAAGKLAEQALL